MTERQIFEAAIEIADPAARQTFLDRACAGDAELLARVLALLQSHTDAGSFLGTPAASVPDATSISADPGEDAFKTEGQPHTPIERDEDDPLHFLSPPTKPGTLGRLAHYEVQKLLGQGAFGIVLQAFDEKLHRLVAIKVMSPEHASTSPPRKRFLREARSAAQIRHDNVVAIHAVEEQPLPYLVMEYVPGVTLETALNEHGPLDVPDVLYLGQQIACGLAAAHAQGLIHRDIKPANILLENGLRGKIKITDFGLARAADDASLTQSGVIAGTPLFMSPEQATASSIDARSDLFSLGSVLYVMASGRPPFRAANTFAALKRVVEDTPRPIQEVIPDVPAWLSAIITKLHAKNPDDRFASAKEVADLLGKCLADVEANRPVQLPAGMRVAESVERASPRSARDMATASSPLAPASGERVKERGDRRTRPQLWLISGAALLVVGLIAWRAFFGMPWPIINRDLANQTGVEATTDPQPTSINSQPIGWHGWPADAPKPAIAPFDAVQAKKHQEEWAAYLKVPVEYENTIGMKFRLIPPGEFLRGSSPEEIAAAKNARPDDGWKIVVQGEGPRHQVILPHPWYLSVYETTQENYQQVLDRVPSYFSPQGEGQTVVAGMNTSQFPVENMSLLDAVDFCSKLSQRESFGPPYRLAGNEFLSIADGNGYRLPTEAEWEFACRAGTTTQFYAGDSSDDLGTVGWYAGNSQGHTHPVGKLSANAYGLYDLHGNVIEWCEDGASNSVYREYEQDPIVNPRFPRSNDSTCIFRGGDYRGVSAESRSSSRNNNFPQSRSPNQGFRVALPVDAVRQALKTTGPALPNAGPKKNLSFTQPGFDDWVKAVQQLPAEEQVAAVAKKLQELNPGFDGMVTHRMSSFGGNHVIELNMTTNSMTDLSPVRALVGLESLSCPGTGEEKTRSVLTDLTPLAGIGLRNLNIQFTQVSDLSPLAGEKIAGLVCSFTNISDLLPLEGMPIEGLQIEHSQVSDLTPLQGMPLRRLACEGNKIADLSPLQNLPLEYLVFNTAAAKDVKLLRSIKTLQTINNQPAAEFWRDVEGK